jgi:hypothetical protein
LPEGAKQRFGQILPLIRVLLKLDGIRRRRHWLTMRIAKLFLIPFRNCRFLRLFGLPLELWSAHGFADCAERQSMTLQRADQPASTVAEALDRFRDELVLPALSE